MNSSQRKYLNELLFKTRFTFNHKNLERTPAEVEAASIMELYAARNQKAWAEQRKLYDSKIAEFNARKEALKVLILGNTAKFEDVLQAIDKLDREYNA